MPEVGFRYISYNKDMPEKTAQDEEERSRSAHRQIVADEARERRRGREMADKQKKASDKAEEDKRRATQEEQRQVQSKKQEESQLKTLKAKKPVEIPYKDARAAAEFLAELRDGDGQVTVPYEKFKRLRNVLLERGYTLEEVEKMSSANIVVEVQGVMRDENVDIAEPTDEAFEARAGTKERKVEENLVRLEIEKARDPEEETLTREKVGKRVVVGVAEAEEKPQTKKAIKEKSTKTERPRIVGTYPHLWSMPRELAEAALSAQGVDIKLPENWNKDDPVKKMNFLNKNGIANTIAFPLGEADPDFELRFIDPKTNAEVYETEGGNYVAINYAPYESEDVVDDINRFFEGVGVDNRLEVPESWSRMDWDERRAWAKKNGMEIARSIAGGGTVFADTPGLGLEQVGELHRRLGVLDDMEEAGTLTSNDDRPEIFLKLEEFYLDYKSRLEDLMNARRIDYESYRDSLVNYDLSQLRALKSIQRIMADPVAFDATFGVAKERILNDLVELGSAEKIIQELLVITPPAGPAALIQGDAVDALGEALDLQFAEARRLAAAGGDGYRFVKNVGDAIETHEILTKGTPGSAVLNRIVSQTARDDLKKLPKDMDDVLRRRAQALGPEVRARLFNPLEIKIKSLEGSLSIGSITLGDFDQQLYEYAKSRPTMAGTEGLLEWRASTTFEGVRLNILREAEYGIPKDWKDSMKNVQNNFRRLESGNSTQDEVGQVRQTITRISDAIPVETLRGKEREKAVEMKMKIDELRDAVIAIYSLRLTMEGHAMDPDKVLEAIAGNNLWKDDTFKIFFDRFFKDHNEDDFKDGAGERFNLLDVAMKIYFEQFSIDKVQMNLVEGLTLVDITKPLGPDDVNEIEVLFGRKLEPPELVKLNELREVILTKVINTMGTAAGGTPAGGPPTAANVEEYWAGGRNRGNAESIVAEWYRENTLVGAHGYKETDPNYHYLKKQKEVLRDNLKARLGTGPGGMGLSGDKVDEFLEAGLLDQVINNGYNVTWTLGGFSDYDGMRIYDRSNKKEDEWFKDDAGNSRKKLAAFVFNNYSDVWFGRMIDHYGEFLQNEVRGRPKDANHVLTKHMIGRRRGILGNNRLIIKLINDKLRNEEKTADSLVADSTAGNFKNVLERKIKTLDNVGKLDLSDAYDYGWARGVALEELLDDGELTLKNISWSEVFSNQKTNIIKYNMGDWWTDRKETKKYFGAEACQAYLNHPDTKTFMGINNRKMFYSTREIRIHTWTKLMVPMHQEMGKHWKEWWGREYDMPSAEIEQILDVAAASNRIDHKDADKLKRSLLKIGRIPGVAPIRSLKEYLEMVRVMGSELKKPSSLMPFFLVFLWALFKGAFSQSGAQVAGK